LSIPDNSCVNTLRFLAVDAVEKAGSGHPGLPLGAAPAAFVLWDRFLRHNPKNPDWFDRDRFILSAGHGSALLYALLHVYGYDLPLQELKRFRQWGSRTPGHPEFGRTPGVEVTTGPLGQGFAMAVGMAVAEKHLAAVFNRPGFDVIDHNTYVLASDGDLMEGVSSEAASLAGHLGLGKLIVLYDDNHISIEGDTDLSFTEDRGLRFEAYDWHVVRVDDGNDLDGIEAAVEAARAETNRPSIVMVRSHIGFGSPKQDSASAHGEPLGKDALIETKKNLGWPVKPDFLIPEEARAHFKVAAERGKKLERDWLDLMERYRAAHPEAYKELQQAISGELPGDWDADVPRFRPGDGPVATRSSSGIVMNSIADRLKMFIGGSADLAPSNKTMLKGQGDFSAKEGNSRNLHFGVREHAMGAIVNGMAVHGALVPFGATFLVFSDYMRPALRMAAMMQASSTFVFTHDSIAVGEDGPTHQPVEQLMSLRAIPGLTVIRPADANEVVAAWRLALKRKGPHALVLTRQNLPVLDPEVYPVSEGTPRGGYILAEADRGPAEIVLIATGSEVHLALEARDALRAEGMHARVVSMPSWEIFSEQGMEYRRHVLPDGIPRLAVEAGVTLGWRDFVGLDGDVVGLDRFGSSAPGNTVLAKLGFNAAHVVERALKLIGK
jgi:transketolase